MPNLSSRRPTEQRRDPRLAAIKAVLTAGVSFTASVATVLGVIGLWQLGDRVTLWGLAAVCLIVALTLGTAAFLMRTRQ
jgi:hypothetical protein